MRYTIYFRNNQLILSDQLDADLEQIVKRENTLFTQDASAESIKATILYLQDPVERVGLMIHADAERVFQSIASFFELVIAAGGVVRNEKDQVLIIHRKGKWDLPKGKLDEGEDIQHCAMREVEEETGVKVDEVEHLIVKTYHVYDDYGKPNLKETWWYAMKASSESHLQPQTEEDITDIKWLSIHEMDSILSKTYPLVRSVVKRWKNYDLR